MEAGFPHPLDPTKNIKLLALIGKNGAVGYGIYWRIIEMLQLEESNKLQLKKYLYDAIGSQMLVPPEDVELIISDMINECELFATDRDYFWEETIQPSTLKKVPANRVSTYRPNKELEKKWSLLEVSLPAKPSDRWIAIKEFITNNKPEFIEPYASAWNIFAQNYKLPQIESITESRRKKFGSRIKEEAFDFFGILEVIKKDNFYRGLNDGSDWKVTWDYIFENDTKYLKILEKKK